MCLEEIYTDEDMNAIVEGLPEVAPGVVRLKKTVDIDTNKDGYTSMFWYGSYRAGINKASCGIIYTEKFRYIKGFHHQTEEDRTIYTKITCLVKKEWITAVGKHRCYNGLIVITSASFFPTYPETEAKLEDFLKCLEQKELCEVQDVKAG